MAESQFLDHTFIVILCGGGGTRVWPMSINNKPKQFLNFYSDKTLYQETVERALLMVPKGRILIITNQQYLEEIKKETPQIPENNIIAEPQKKNTAMAMGVAAAFAKKIDPEAVLINLASDQVIENLDVFTHTMKTAAQVAYESRYLMAVGIEPSFAHPGLGYIQVGDEVMNVNSLPVCKALGFKEKPSIEVAKTYLESKQYLWNANNYVWRADSILEAFDRLSPAIATYIHEVEAAIGTPDQARVMQQAYIAVPAEPIDTAISEKTDNLYLISGKYTWNDIGGWKVVYELGNKDEAGNVIIKNYECKDNLPVITHNASNNLIFHDDQPLAIVGLSNIIVIDTGRGLLICDREQSNDVKKVVEILQAQGLEQYL